MLRFNGPGIYCFSFAFRIISWSNFRNFPDLQTGSPSGNSEDYSGYYACFQEWISDISIQRQSSRVPNLAISQNGANTRN